ncbi:haloacid dehalogenase [Spongiactinospora gelatinilytica]|uniref:Haloacid dehalogenase n=1 Tax=Spongiactinospora gelatinilytica TaxID=2666298 RepID=A0A2W2HH35_9ACTN|nr:HAD family hydrolase [Spongiactinospora gelatinilytica]PZG45427.1 haloacid dehalogenase [Spongiactinospora gelatinilytica]
MREIRALVFDVGETLIDESRLWARWADRLGVPTLTLMGLIGGMAALGRSQMDALRLVRPDFDLLAESAAWRAEDPTGLRENFDADDLYPDVRRALGALRAAGYQVVLAGNQPPQAAGALAAMDLPVDAIHTSAEWGVEKPDPAFFAKVASVVGREPAQILYVGDRLDNDVLPARAAGMRTALLRRGPWGFLHAARPEADQADVVIGGLDELVALLHPRV